MARKKEYLATGTSKVPPAHTGEILREDELPALGMTVNDTVRALRIRNLTMRKPPRKTQVPPSPLAGEGWGEG